MSYEVRARSFGEILDLGFRLCRDHFALLATVALPLYAVLVTFQILTPGNPAAMGVGLSLGLVGAALSYLIVAPIVSAAITYAISEVFVGRTPSARDSLNTSIAIILPLIGTAILAFLMTAFGFFLLVIPGLYLMMALMLSNQVCVVERRFGMAALRRSRELVRGHMGRASGVLFVSGLLILVLSAGVAILGSIPVVGAFLGPIPTVLQHMFSSAVAVVLYYDIRCRKEAFDIQHLAEIVGAAAATNGSAADGPFVA